MPEEHEPANGRLNLILQSILTNQQQLGIKVDAVASELRTQIAETQTALEAKIEQHRDTSVSKAHCEAQHAQTNALIAKADKLTWKNVSAALGAVVLIGAALKYVEPTLESLTTITRAFGGP